MDEKGTPEPGGLQADALKYLRGALGDRAPEEIVLEGVFDEEPLEGEGRVEVFRFELSPMPDVPERAVATEHYLVVGETEPNYFPVYGLTADEAYSFHIGTRFVAVMGLAVVDAADEPAGARAAMRNFVGACNPGVDMVSEEVAGVFRCGEQVFVVYKLRLGGREVYCMGGGLPPGFYAHVEYPPQVALRLHVGQLVRQEARSERGRSEGRRPS